MSGSTPQRRILIAGGGIGGLTAALCLAKAGFETVVFEQAPDFAEIGAGIQLSPNCSRVLHHLGLEPELRQAAFLPQATEFRDWKTGRLITSSQLGERVRERYGAPYYHIHRGDLLTILAEAARRNGAIDLRKSSRVEAIDSGASASVETVDQDAHGVRIAVNGKSEQGDALIGADGIHSTVRSGLFGDRAPTFTGNVAWRALVPADRLPAGLVRPMATAWWGPHKHFVHYCLQSGALVNCVCVVEKTGWEIESWTPGELDELKRDFTGWHPEVQALIDNMDRHSLYKWALHDRPPMVRWGEGAVTLLGDACHPTLPFMAQGAAMAIEDAAVLAGCLADDDSVVAALRRYEKLRRPRTARIQNGSRRNAALFHLTGAKAWLRDQAVKWVGGRTMDALFRYDALLAVQSADGQPRHARQLQ